jgi:predicted TIM-barrel fold metal-dependent hydrolase
MHRRALLAALALPSLARGQTDPQVNWRLPEDACDTHTHVFLDQARYPLAADRFYTPSPATTEALRDFHRALGFSRVVIVQPSVYGDDNAAAVAGIAEYGAARGIAVLDRTQADLDVLHAAGMRGLRINLEVAGQADARAAEAALARTVQRIGTRGWHIQTNTRLSVVAALEPVLAALPVPIVFDHFARIQAGGGSDQPGYPALRRLLRAGKAYVKISGPYNASRDAPHYADLLPVVRELLEANPDRLLWGSNWPHPGTARGDIGRVTPFREVDNIAWLNALATYAPDEATRRRILVHNPQALFGPW